MGMFLVKYMNYTVFSIVQNFCGKATYVFGRGQKSKDVPPRCWQLSDSWCKDTDDNSPMVMIIMIKNYDGNNNNYNSSPRTLCIKHEWHFPAM